MPSKVQSIFLGGLIVGLLSTSYLGLINFACCAGVIIGAMVAVWHYTNENSLTIPPGQGALMGLLAAVVGAFVALALDQVVRLVGIPGSQELTLIMQERLMGAELGPEQREVQEEMMRQFQTPLYMIISFAFTLAVTAVFGAIGGAIGASIFKKGGDRPTPAMDTL
jgi:uncharacterized membrane protein YeaQ/YmgE (transglycosylase-associated protein family)